MLINFVRNRKPFCEVMEIKSLCYYCYYLFLDEYILKCIASVFDYSWSKIKIGSLIELSIPWQTLLFVLARGLELVGLDWNVVTSARASSISQQYLVFVREDAAVHSYPLFCWASLKIKLLDFQLSLNPHTYLGVELLASFCSRAHIAISLMAREKNTPEFFGYWPSRQNL